MAVIVNTDECIACGVCETACESRAITVDDTTAVVDEQLCNDCGTCVDECAVEALSLPENG